MTGAEANIKVHHLTRVEGHGDIVATIRNGRIKELRFEVVEAPRLFESFLRGHDYRDVAHMASRICGICAVSHRSAALKAVEAAFGVTLSEQTVLLRRLAFHGEVLSSHILHIYFLAAPDFLDIPSLFHLRDDPEVIQRAMEMKNLAYTLCGIVAGRHTHPVAMSPGGFNFVHEKETFASLKPQLEKALDGLERTVDMVKTFSLPRFERETEYASLTHEELYAFYDGDIFSSEQVRKPARQYDEVITEYVVPYSTAKHARWVRPQYMVGALARVNNNFERLSPMAKGVADELGLTVPCFNPFKILLAQVVECVHCLEESMEIIDHLLERGIRAEEEMVAVEPRAGRGVGAVEAPRGILFHDYTFDDRGKCLAVNMVIPTAQNLANLEEDMHHMVPGLIGGTEEEMTKRLEMLARAYDPCISCSTHVIVR
jgi:coenzyme F420-reducing hydrogenase alpha subunit